MKADIDNIDQNNINKLIDTLSVQKIKYEESKLNEVILYAKIIYKDNYKNSKVTFFNHCIGVAIRVAILNLDINSIYSAILHEVIRFKEYDEIEFLKKFGKEILDIIIGVEKLSYLNFTSSKQVQLETFRNMFMAIAKDIRIVIIKLCDRLYTMENIKELDEEYKQKKAEETLMIYAPIAHRLGMSSIKSELEDIAFRILYPQEYANIKKQIDEKKEQREEYIKSNIENIQKVLYENNIEATVYGRPKHFYSIYKKMQNKKCEVNDLFDLLAIRIIVKDIKDCYTVLGIIHELYKPMPKRFKDYIAVPKTNLYRSLHTTVFGENAKPFEVQIRTLDMHKVAEYGIAAHFLYKENKETKSKKSEMSEYDQKLNWIRQILEIPETLKDSNETIDKIKLELFAEEIFVFTPKGDIKALPKDSTTIDFAYSIHQKIAEKMIGAKINGRLVPIATKLNNTDIIEIITSNISNGPNIDWLKAVKTNSARSKIIAFLKKKDATENILRGKEIFENKIRTQKISKEKLITEEYIKSMLKHFSLNSLDECYENIGFGSIPVIRVINKLIEEYKKDPQNVLNDEKENISVKKSNNSNNSDTVIVDGIDNCLIKIAKCCNPIPGDDIVGYITYSNGVSVHEANCTHLKNLDVINRRINVRWKQESKNEFYTNIRILTNERQNMLSDILQKLQELKIQASHVNLKKVVSQGIYNIEIGINVENALKLQKVINELKKVEGVFDARRSK